MKAVKIMATIDGEGQLTLDNPLVVDEYTRVEVIVLIPEETEINEDEDETEIDEDEDDQTKEEILENFRQAWHEAMTGKTIPVSQIWEGIEDV